MEFDLPGPSQSQQQDSDVQPQAEAYQPDGRQYRLILNEQARKAKVQEAHLHMKRIIDKLRLQTGAEVSYIIVHIQPHSEMVESSDFYSTPHLQRMDELMQESALFECQLSISSQQQQKRIQAFSITPFGDLLKEHQIKLLKWVLKQLVTAQKRTAPFDRTTANQMHEQYPWYPQSVCWTRPKNMTAQDLQTLFEACMGAIGSKAAELIDSFQCKLPLKLPPCDQMKCLSALRFEAQVSPPPVPDQLIPGKLYGIAVTSAYHIIVVCVNVVSKLDCYH